MELVYAAQAGDMAALGLLIAENRAGMMAAALSMLRDPAAAEDAVQDATIVAIRRIRDVRDPEAVGGWLCAVVRNICRMRIRESRTVPAGLLTDVVLPSREPAPDELLDEAATQGWLWRALGELSEPLRLVTVLRYFSDVSSYEQIAALCGIPVGTVRSRLNQAKGNLTELLRRAAGEQFGDLRARTAARWRDAEQVLAGTRNGEFAAVVRDGWWPDVRTLGPQGEVGLGRDFVVDAMDSDVQHGVRQRLTNVIGSTDLLIWEAELITSPDHADYCCQPSVVWLMTLREHRVKQLRLFHPVARTG
ncbi:RNA polymerase sigma factor [Dactylosporangium sucinum]|uniref:DNA-directed RNA polymerase sigma-70 factor n=1 Tax=Dactylosporangium sucinum TaxID=1424081 RepID=A0A917UCW6_9ACTN|nr:sigma-70 family RNA polymerase sigma factor [Dactylosporangium sucinum]GGM83494.1 DNA-directed RNA polymerase sigma-70 factor [Dactylosporangium sucinum]